MPKRQGLGGIFAIPLGIALLSSVALILALTGDGWPDILSWTGLAVPVLAVGWAMQVRRS
ncbi:hypothetical protein [Sphingomonas xinjiangensis]|uniref:DUF4175 domain-containing protein n=1 Tax=Sphingomonas xinjiangensis TaxID=643568 RepID=A0A840YP60_9SPHN|nr:hypothetical protein [Sphingomonas xinjiangensis]MBB5709851.1 hypothetical protein [Sphingomonas xinjiangensis]